jgi:hypothetical protein
VRGRRIRLIVAAGVVVVFVVLHLAGARAATSFLSGTRSADAELVLGSLYVLAWFGVVIAVPVVVIAEACGRIWEWVGSRRR